MSTANLSTNSAPAQSYTAVNSGIDGATRTEGETLFQQASQSHQPDVLVKRQFEQHNQSQKSKLANEFIASAGREGLSQLAATPDGQHALAVVYDHAGSDGRGTMRQVHEEQGNTAVDYTERNASQYDLDSIAAMPDKRGYFERIGDELRGSVVVGQPLGERFENAAVAAYSGDPNDNLDGIESRALVAKGWARSLVDGLQGLAQDPIGIIRDPAILGYDQIQTAFYYGTDGLLGDQNSVARNQERTESLQNFVEAVKTSTNDPEKVGYLAGGALLGMKKGRFPDATNRTPKLLEGAYSLIGADKAVINSKKLTEYALNPDHPRGRHKARVFEAALGFNRSNADDLMAQLQQGVKNNTPILGKVDQYGERFTVEIPVVGPKGEGVVTSGWIYKPGSNVPELTTILVKKNK